MLMIGDLRTRVLSRRVPSSQRTVQTVSTLNLTATDNTIKSNDARN
uniref:Uncharacterized protein n=1 Tax=Anguilla anguilla TaxID=7936 RepID=A0A0E9PB60_ANGAN